MQSNEVRDKFLKFFEKRGHKIIPSASLIPENDSSVLFTTAGMQQFKLYYTGEKNAEKDFETKNVVSVQKCVRTSDIDEVGDDTHLTFFEMLGNFSFGGYWKQDAIAYAYEFITVELGLEIDYVSVFEGDSETPADEESREIWKNIDPKLIIKNHNRADNFWGPTGDEGPCGPTTEIYINGVEIWNIVFNEFYKTKEGKYKPLETRGIDTGMGLERLLVQVQKKNNVYETDLFNNEKKKEERIVADHVKASLFMISDGIVPLNTGAGYILRRLLRRAVRFSKQSLMEQITKVKKVYESIYALDDKGEIKKEEDKFRITLRNVDNLFKEIKETKKQIDFSKKINNPQFLKVFKQKIEYHFKDDNTISGQSAFHLVQSHGAPIESIKDFAYENGLKIDLEDFNKRMAEHQKLSQTSSAGMFKGGLANHEPKTIKLHTAHHLLLAGLKEIVNKDIKQRGSNINEERLRMDFLCDHKLTDEEKKKVEDWVNEKIKNGFNVIRKEMPLAEAEKLGAEMEFGAKYPDLVSVYMIEDKDSNVISKEFCGGPHISNSSELGVLKIQKEEAVAQGIRRIKAVLVV